MIHNNVHTIELLWTDLDTVESLKKIPNESIDRILVANILFQLEHPEHLFQECIRVLKKEGKLLCIDWRESFNHTGPHPQAIVHQDTARHIMTTVGFQVRKDTCDVGPHHYGLLAYK